jgi:UDP-3-O-[3-hydroxymyristoyl] N-acetylglucosamine deacetylase
VIGQTVRVGDSQRWIEAQPPRSAGLSISFDLDYSSCKSIGRQTYAVDLTPDAFRREIASCRTFITEDVAQAMLAEGRGTRVTPQDLLIFGPHGPVDNSLRFADECARHKLLDVVGDLALTGCEIIGHVVACHSGHQLHVELAKRLLEQADVNQRVGVPFEQRKCA